MSKFVIDSLGEVVGERYSYPVPPALFEHAQKSAKALYTKLNVETHKAAEVIKFQFSFLDNAPTIEGKVIYTVSSVWEYWGEKLEIKVCRDFNLSYNPEHVANIVLEAFRNQLKQRLNSIMEKGQKFADLINNMKY